MPNLSELFIEVTIVENIILINPLLQEFDQNNSANLEKITLNNVYVSEEELKSFSEKMSSLQLRTLDIRKGYVITGNLSALFTHSLLSLNTLILRLCRLNSDDMNSLAEAEVNSRLPQLKHLDISENRNVEIRDLFTHSAQWNQLKTLAINDHNVLDVNPEFLSSLEELHLEFPLTRTQNPVPHITRCWWGLKLIRLVSEKGLSCIADGVERGMFPCLTILRFRNVAYNAIVIPSLYKLYRANIFVQDYTPLLFLNRRLEWKADVWNRNS